MPNFEVFNRRAPGSRAGHATVTVGQRGVLLLSTALMEALGSPKAVRLLSDRSEGRAALAPAGREDADARPVQEVRGTGRLSAKPFCEFLGLDLSESRRYEVTITDGMAVFDYRGPSAVVTGNRAAKKGAGS